MNACLCVDVSTCVTCHVHLGLRLALLCRTAPAGSHLHNAVPISISVACLMSPGMFRDTCSASEAVECCLDNLLAAQGLQYSACVRKDQME